MEFALSFGINIVRIYKFAILARVLISWMQVNNHNRIVVLIYQVTEPPLRFLRGILPRMGMLDLSPLLAFIALDLLQMAMMDALN